MEYLLYKSLIFVFVEHNNYNYTVSLLFLNIYACNKYIYTYINNKLDAKSVCKEISFPLLMIEIIIRKILWQYYKFSPLQPFIKTVYYISIYSMYNKTKKKYLNSIHNQILTAKQNMHISYCRITILKNRNLCQRNS